MQRDLEAYISRDVLNIFRGHSLVAVNEVLPGQIRVDFHLKDKNGAILGTLTVNRCFQQQA